MASPGDIFRTFAAMKKWCASILFIVSFFAAAAHTQQPGEKKACTPIHVKSAAFFNNNDSIGFSHFAIQGAGITAVAAHQQVQQKTTTGDDFTTAFIAAFSITTTCTNAKQIDLFGNTLLSHNYPAHNFW